MRKYRKGCIVILCLLAFVCIAGFRVGGYRIFDYVTEEDGSRHFMLFGKIGPSGNVTEEGDAAEKDTETEKPSEEVGSVPEITDNAPEDPPPCQ